MATAGSLWVRLGLDSKGYRRGLGKAKKETSSFNKHVKRMAGTVAGLFAGREIARFVGSLRDAASDAQETASKFGTVFSNISKEANDTASSLAKNYGLANTTAKELLGNTGDLLTGLGATEDTALNLSNTTQQLAVDLASFTNVEGGAKRASEALTKAMLGERESLKQYGIVIRETELKQRLAKKGLDDLTGTALLQAKAQETLAMAMVQSKNAIGDYARTSDQFANRQRRLSELFKTMKIQLGQELLPIFSKLQTALIGIVKWVTENKEEILSWIKTIGIAVGAFAGTKGLISVINMGRRAVGLFRGGFKALNATMKANIFIAIASLIFALIMKIREAWKESEKFRAVVKYVARSVAGFFEKAWIRIKYGVKILWEKVKGYFNMIADAAKVIWNSLKAVFDPNKNPADVWKEGFAKIGKDIANLGKEARKEMNQELDAIKTPNYKDILAGEKAKQEAKESGKDIGNEVAEGVREGLKSGSKRVGSITSKLSTKSGLINTNDINAALQGIDGVIRKTQRMQDEFRNSTQLGLNFTGIMRNAFQGMENVIADAINGTQNIFKSFWNFFKNFIKGLIIKLITAAIAAAALAAAVSLIPGMGIASGVSGTFGGEFMKGFKMLTNLQGMATGGDVIKGGQFLVGERGVPEIVNLPKGSSVSPAGNRTKHTNSTRGGGSYKISVRGSEIQWVIDRDNRLKKRTE